jgi:hypothetical protein
MLRALSFAWAISLAGCSSSGNSPPIEDLAAPPDLARSVDLGADLGSPAAAPRADPFISSGGGSGTSTNRQLNLTIGAHGGAGRAVSGSGATITFGAFATQTY